MVKTFYFRCFVLPLSVLLFLTQHVYSMPAGYIDASTYGYNATDATAALQTAINTGQNVYVPNMGTPWIVTPITLTQSNQQILFENGTVISAKTGSFTSPIDSLFTATNVSNVKMTGYGATFQMNKLDYTQPPYEKGEWRNGIRLNDVSQFQIEGLTIKDTGGDGILINGSPTGYSQDLVIRNLVLDNNYRQGISVISAKNLLIDNVAFLNTNGTAPQAGIDFEPDFPDQVLQNITVRNSIFSSNGGHGIQFATGMMADPSQADITITNITSYGNGYSGLYIYYYPLPGVKIKNSLFVGNPDYGAYVTRGNADASMMNSIDYSAFWGNKYGFGGWAKNGPGTISNTNPLFYSTDPSSEWFMYLDPAVSNNILHGADDGSYMGARPLYGTLIPEPATAGMLAGIGIVLMARRPRQTNCG